MNVYELITNEELVDNLEKYEWDPDWNTSWMVENENLQVCSKLFKIKPEIWNTTLNVYHQYKPSNKQRAKVALQTLENYYESYVNGCYDFERYVDRVSNELGSRRRWRTQNDIRDRLREEFNDYFEETEAFIQEYLTPFMLKKLAVKLFKVAEEGIEKVKAKSPKKEAS